MSARRDWNCRSIDDLNLLALSVSACEERPPRRAAPSNGWIAPSALFAAHLLSEAVSANAHTVALQGTPCCDEEHTERGTVRHMVSTDVAMRKLCRFFNKKSRSDACFARKGDRIGDFQIVFVCCGAVVHNWHCPVPSLCDRMSAAGRS